MISAYLLSLALALVAPPKAHAAQDDSDDPAIHVSLNEDGRFQRGDEGKVYVRTQQHGYLVVVHVDPDSRVRVLFPLDPGDDNFVRGGKKYQIVGRGDRESFEVDVRSGRGTVYAAVSAEPFRFDGFIVGDHWDFRALNDVAVTRDTEADLNELVRRWATTDFDYDLIDYDVYERVYASGYGRTEVYYTPTYYSSVGDPYYSSCFGYWCGGSSLFIGIGIGNPYFYSPYHYYPYRPFFPAYYYPYRPYYYPYTYYPYSYSYYYPYRPFRPYYPYRYRDPFRYRGPGSHYAGGYYFGGHYAAPWRNRSNDRFYSNTYAWRGREATTDLAKGDRFSTGYRGRGFDRGDAGGTSGSRPGGASPRRRSDVPAPNVTPVRTADRRPAVVVAHPARPEGRPARDRGSDRAARDRSEIAPRMPVRVGAGADGTPEPTRAEPRAREESRGVSREFAESGLDDRRRGYESGVIEGRREIDARGPEDRGPGRVGAREMVDDRPASRYDGGRDAPESRRESREVRDRPTFDPRPSPRAEPRSSCEIRSACRSARPR